MPRRVAIVGAGLAGLAAGRELARSGWAVAVFERWPDVGGQASAFEVGDGVWLERYYHHLFQSDAEIIRLHDELLPGRLEWHRSTVGMFAAGRIWPFVTPLDLLAYAPLPPVDRVRLGLATLRLTGRRDWERMDDVAAIDWLRRNCGERALAAVWMPLLLGKFGADAERVPLAWLGAKLALRRKLRGAGAAKEELGYPQGSFRTIGVALADDIRRHGGTVHVDREVLEVRPDGEEHRVLCAVPGAYRVAAGAASAYPAAEHRADVVLFTTPTFVTRRLAAWPADYLTLLDAWSYRTAVVLLLELRVRFSDTYWTNIADPNVPFLGLIEHTNLVPADRYPGRYLYVANYVAADHPITLLDTEALLELYLPALARIRPGFGPADVLRRWSFREPAAQPVPQVGNRHRIMPFETPRRGLFIANTTQIYPEDRGTNYSAQLGRRAAERIAATD